MDTKALNFEGRKDFYLDKVYDRIVSETEASSSCLFYMYFCLDFLFFYISFN